MDSLTHFQFKNIYFYVHHSNSKVTELEMLHIETPASIHEHYTAWQNKTDLKISIYIISIYFKHKFTSIESENVFIFQRLIWTELLQLFPFVVHNIFEDLHNVTHCYRSNIKVNVLFCFYFLLQISFQPTQKVSPWTSGVQENAIVHE